MAKTKEPKSILVPSSRIGYASLGLAVLIVSYVLGLESIDSGSYWFYAGWILTLIIALKLIKRAIKFNNHGNKTTRKKT